MFSAIFMFQFSYLPYPPTSVDDVDDVDDDGVDEDVDDGYQYNDVDEDVTVRVTMMSRLYPVHPAIYFSQVFFSLNRSRHLGIHKYFSATTCALAPAPAYFPHAPGWVSI